MRARLCQIIRQDQLYPTLNLVSFLALFLTTFASSHLPHGARSSFFEKTIFGIAFNVSANAFSSPFVTFGHYSENILYVTLPSRVVSIVSISSSCSRPKLLIALGCIGDEIYAVFRACRETIERDKFLKYDFSHRTSSAVECEIEPIRSKRNDDFNDPGALAYIRSKPLIDDRGESPHSVQLQEVYGERIT